MGRYKEYRDPPRRRSYDQFPPDEPFVPVRYPTQASHNLSEPVAATVRWFNPEKGFGFVALPDGTDAFLHISQVEAFGHNSVPEKARLRVRVAPGHKGIQVTEVVDLTVDAADAGAGLPSPNRNPEPSRIEGLGTGTVKWFDAAKGFGFITSSAGGKDVFVHISALQRSGLSTLAEGQRIRMKVEQVPKGVEAKEIELLD